MDKAIKEAKNIISNRLGPSYWSNYDAEMSKDE